MTRKGKAWKSNVLQVLSYPLSLDILRVLREKPNLTVYRLNRLAGNCGHTYMLKRLKQLQKRDLVTSKAEDWYKNGDKIGRKKPRSIRRWNLNTQNPLVEAALRMVELQREAA